MSQQPQDSRTPAQKILDFYRHHGFFTSDRATCNELTRLDDENKSLRAQVERLQAGGQVAAPAMVPVSHIALQDAWNALNPQDSNRDYFTAGVRWAERAHGIGLTVGGSNGGGA